MMKLQYFFLLIIACSMGIAGCSPSTDSKLLYEASRRPNAKAMKKAIAAGADVNYYEEGGFSVLYWTVRTPVPERLDLVTLLLEKGADVNWKGEYGDSILLTAASAPGDPYKVVDLLIDNGADINYMSIQQQKTSLMMASSAGNIQTVKLLIEKGVDVNIVNKKGDTALSEAISNSHTGIAAILVENGAK